MSVLRIIHYGHPRLTQVADEVEELGEQDQDLIESMIETMYDADGIGLAATQVGVMKRIFVVDANRDRDDDSQRDPMVFINPVIIDENDEDAGFEEGCLSIPKLYGEVYRPTVVTVQARDRDFEPFEIECDGLLARVVQHELDHLDGILYIDRMSEQDREKLAGSLRKIREATRQNMPPEDQVYPIIDER